MKGQLDLAKMKSVFVQITVKKVFDKDRQAKSSSSAKTSWALPLGLAHFLGFIKQEKSFIDKKLITAHDC